MRRPALLLHWRLACQRPLLRLHYAVVEGRARLAGLAQMLALRNWASLPDEWFLVAEFARRYPTEAIRAFALLEARERLRRRLAQRGQWIAAALALLYGVEAVLLARLGHTLLAGLFALFSLAGFVYVLALSRATRRLRDPSTQRRVRPP
ncbi:hypothetical protein [Massilia sp. TS11]|uniref:hypothetical protein n=1 Tax=Massilia sp. TS11 TaxID=2908003 RepID=UPI001EDBD7D7|nr:hypothetical protein [Massilia sp. TS11]MCG2583226.1 hypothetical protein [Massilia sp. TS11]